MEDGNLSPIPVCDVLSHYKESCFQPAHSTTASIPNPTSSPAQVPQTSSCPQRDFPKSPNSQMQLKVAITKDKCHLKSKQHKSHIEKLEVIPSEESKRL